MGTIFKVRYRAAAIAVALVSVAALPTWVAGAAASRPTTGQTADPANPVDAATRPATEPTTEPATRETSSDSSATQPATRSAKGRDPASVERRRQTLFDALMKRYASVLATSKDRIGRSVVVICMAGVPRHDATVALLDVLRTEKDLLVAMVAWQGMLARSADLSAADYAAWMDLTVPLFERRAFRGDLRVGLLRALAAGPADRRAKELFAKCFAGTSSQDPDDVPTLWAMGKALRAWGDPGMAEALLNQLADPNAAMRAEAVMHAAGCDLPYAAERWELGSKEMWRQATNDYASWWRQERPRWAGPRRESAEPWRALPAQFVPAIDPSVAVNPDDPKWYKDLEIGRPDVKTFDVGLVVDATGSMGEVLEWLRRDVKRMMEAMSLMAPTPRIALTFYRDHGDNFVARSYPLTDRVDQLARQLANMDAHGGGDEPEAVAEGLADCLKASKWNLGGKTRNALVLIGDAPPHPQTRDGCEAMVKAAAARGIRLYAVKVQTGEQPPALESFDRLAAAGGGTAVSADLRFWRLGYGPWAFGWQHLPNVRTAAEGEAPPAATNMPGEAVLRRVLVGAINPEFENRVGPPVSILWHMLKEPNVERREPFPVRPRNDSKVVMPPVDKQKR